MEVPRITLASPRVVLGGRPTMMARRGGMVPTFFIVLCLLFLGYVGMSYWQVRKALEDTKIKAKQFQQQQESLTAQLQGLSCYFPLH